MTRRNPLCRCVVMDVDTLLNRERLPWQAIAAAHAAALAQNKRRKNETTVVNSDESDTSDTNREGNTNTKGQDSFRDAGETDKTVGVRGFTPEYPLHANGEGVAILPNQGGPGGSQEVRASRLASPLF